MSDSQDTTGGAPEKAPRSVRFDALGTLALVAGALVLLVWLGLLAGSFLGFDQHASRQVSDILLGVVVAAGLLAVVATPRVGLVTLIAAVAFGAAWRYIGWGLTYAGDALFYSMAAAFYLLPIVVGVTAIVAGRSRSKRRAHRTAAATP